MEKNIFENAYFGKPYKTRGEKKAIYWRHAYRHHLFTESGPIECDDSGKFSSCCPDLSTQFDIVGEWKEQVDEEKLNELAEEYESKQIAIAKQGCALGQCIGIDFISGFKAGYRKAIDKFNK